MRKLLVVGGLAALAGCATGPSRPPVEVSRYHFDPVAERGSVTIETMDSGASDSVEYKTYATAVMNELIRLGFTPVPQGSAAAPLFRATISFGSETRPMGPPRAPASVGIGLGGGGDFGGGGYRRGGGGGIGVGGGVSFPVGHRSAPVGIASMLSVRLRRGPDAVWEGKAEGLTPVRAPDATPDAIAARLSHALFTGFPGDSGRTIEVP